MTEDPQDKVGIHKHRKKVSLHKFVLLDDPSSRSMNWVKIRHTCKTLHVFALVDEIIRSITTRSAEKQTVSD